MALRARKWRDSRHFFYWRFYDSLVGRIVGLATEKEHLRDGLAVAHVARFFPISITIELARRSIRKGTNTIFVGWSSLLHDPQVQPYSGVKPPVARDEKLKGTLRNMRDTGSLRITGSRNRYVTNVFTGEAFRPTPPGAKGHDGEHRDYGVIRRQFRGASENIVILEGVQRVGTLGTSKVAMELRYLDEFHRAIKLLDGFKESNQLEILVETTLPANSDELYTLEEVEARPLLMIYNRRWVLNLTDGSDEWIDQAPWDVQLGMAKESHPRQVTNDEIEAVPHRIEIRADLRGEDESLRASCAKLLTAERRRRPVQTTNKREIKRLIDELTRRSDAFDIKVWCESDQGDDIVRHDLPRGYYGLGARRGKRLLVHLALCRLWQLPLNLTGSSVRKLLPRFKPEKTGADLVEDFMVEVRGKLRQNFGDLFGTKDAQKNLVYVVSSTKPRAYSLELDRAVLIVRLRI